MRTQCSRTKLDNALAVEIFRTLNLKKHVYHKAVKVYNMHARNVKINIHFQCTLFRHTVHHPHSFSVYFSVTKNFHKFKTSFTFQVWRINIDVPEEGKNASIDTGDGDRWWEQVDLKKLILASNQIKELSSEIKNLPALNVLDVCTLISPEISLMSKNCVRVKLVQGVL